MAYLSFLVSPYKIETQKVGSILNDTFKFHISFTPSFSIDYSSMAPIIFRSVSKKISVRSRMNKLTSLERYNIKRVNYARQAIFFLYLVSKVEAKKKKLMKLLINITKLKLEIEATAQSIMDRPRRSHVRLDSYNAK